ncbi:hypothetical protein KUTeg_016880 [Tegillarca granosa]|uniref:Uncharacterized protein n=1 Tax=Tegillarca granosa TaxID=220873 RepID=A0ABQ9EMD9_TEGGR|nr:hypothetical protein KUTeg_016880 [Tegillarca granosa]
MFVLSFIKLSQKFGEVAHKMPLPLVEPVEKMINKDIRYRPTAQLFSLFFILKLKNKTYKIRLFIIINNIFLFPSKTIQKCTLANV